MTDDVAGHRQTTPYLENLRSEYLGQWLAVTDTSYDSKKELCAGRVIATARSARALDESILTRGEDLIVLPPNSFTEEFDACYGACGAYAERRAIFDEVTAELHHPATHAVMAAIAVARAPVFTEKPHAYAYFVLNRFVPNLYRSMNFANALLVVGADDENKSRGHFQELLQAYNRANEHGDEVVATQLIVTIPGVGSTDVDVLTSDGRWLEIKRYGRPLSLEKKLEAKLNVFGEALKRALIISAAGRDVVVRRIELHALKTVTRPAKRYAQERGIAVFENSVYPLKS